MFTTMSTMTIGLNYGAPAGDLKGTPVPLDVAMDNIKATMAHHGIDCFTVVECKCYWMGEPAASLRIEVLHNDGHKDVVEAARWLKVALMQEAVLVTKQDIQGDLV